MSVFSCEIIVESNSPRSGRRSADLKKPLEEIDRADREHGSVVALLIGVIAACWSLYQLWIASPLPFIVGFGIISGVPARGVHLAGAGPSLFALFDDLAEAAMVRDRLMFHGYRAHLTRLLPTWPLEGLPA